ncbi:uncharacterized protein LOC120350852 [Nilaparvata lugens]|uniref:uncharacterized protein LOC120350852 n=1 Tax=Nilaparvata lugens TaxID=108931 RepID=UPI00193D4DA5|nr:uncharacterized protein LOC120350852 [Nilaparvata lugens]
MSMILHSISDCFEAGSPICWIIFQLHRIAEDMAAAKQTGDGRKLTASDIVDCLEDGNLSDIEIINKGESDDELTIPQIDHQVKQIGADAVSRNEVITTSNDDDGEVSLETIDNDVTDQNVTSSSFQYKDTVTSKKNIQ